MSLTRFFLYLNERHVVIYLPLGALPRPPPLGLGVEDGYLGFPIIILQNVIQLYLKCSEEV